MIPILDRQIHLLTGKGGVGEYCLLRPRSSFRARGLKTLLVQLHAEDAHSACLDLPPVTHDLTQARNNLWVVNIHPAHALKEYMILKLSLNDY